MRNVNTSSLKGRTWLFVVSLSLEIWPICRSVVDLWRHIKEEKYTIRGELYQFMFEGFFFTHTSWEFANFSNIVETVLQTCNEHLKGGVFPSSHHSDLTWTLCLIPHQNISPHTHTHDSPLVPQKVDSLLVNFKTSWAFLLRLSMQLSGWGRRVFSGGKPRRGARSCWFLSQRKSRGPLCSWRGNEKHFNFHANIAT